MYIHVLHQQGNQQINKNRFALTEPFRKKIKCSNLLHCGERFLRRVPQAHVVLRRDIDLIFAYMESYRMYRPLSPELFDIIHITAFQKSTWRVRPSWQVQRNPVQAISRSPSTIVFVTS